LRTGREPSARARSSLERAAASPSDAESLATFLRVGAKGKSAVDLGRDLIEQFGSRTGRLSKVFPPCDSEFFNRIDPSRTVSPRKADVRHLHRAGETNRHGVWCGRLGRPITACCIDPVGLTPRVDHADVIQITFTHPAVRVVAEERTAFRQPARRPTLRTVPLPRVRIRKDGRGRRDIPLSIAARHGPCHGSENSRPLVHLCARACAAASSRYQCDACRER